MTVFTNGLPWKQQPWNEHQEDTLLGPWTEEEISSGNGNRYSFCPFNAFITTNKAYLFYVKDYWRPGRESGGYYDGQTGVLVSTINDDGVIENWEYEHECSKDLLAGFKYYSKVGGPGIECFLLGNTLQANFGATYATFKRKHEDISPIPLDKVYGGINNKWFITRNKLYCSPIHATDNAYCEIGGDGVIANIARYSDGSENYPSTFLQKYTTYITDEGESFTAMIADCYNGSTVNVKEPAVVTLPVRNFSGGNDRIYQFYVYIPSGQTTKNTELREHGYLKAKYVEVNRENGEISTWTDAGCMEYIHNCRGYYRTAGGSVLVENDGGCRILTGVSTARRLYVFTTSRIYSGTRRYVSIHTFPIKDDASIGQSIYTERAFSVPFSFTNHASERQARLLPLITSSRIYLINTALVDVNGGISVFSVWAPFNGGKNDYIFSVPKTKGYNLTPRISSVIQLQDKLKGFNPRFLCRAIARTDKRVVHSRGRIRLPLTVQGQARKTGQHGRGTGYRLRRPFRILGSGRQDDAWVLRFKRDEVL